MTKTEIKRRLETLDKLEARWQRFGMDADQGTHDCELCLEAGGNGCWACTWKICSNNSCIAGPNSPLFEARDLNSIQPILDAVSRMRAWLKWQENPLLVFAQWKTKEEIIKQWEKP